MTVAGRGLSSNGNGSGKWYYIRRGERGVWALVVVANARSFPFPLLTSFLSVLRCAMLRLLQIYDGGNGGGAN